MISISVRAPAKLNLFLHVYDKRPDGYHNIRTLFERINLFDTITLKKIKDSRIIVSCNSREVPGGRQNLAYKAALALKNRFRIKEGLKITIGKDIPVAAGLGGGSSDAASVLLALNKLWQLKLDKVEILNIAAGLGADVPFFITNYSLSLSDQPQQIFKPLRVNSALWHILVVPKVKLSTKRVFEQFDRLKQPGLKAVSRGLPSPKLTLTKKGKDVNIITRLLTKMDGWQDSSQATRIHYNSLENAAILCTPEIGKIMQELLYLRPVSIGMSGSGPSVFAIIDSRKEGERIKEKFSRFKSWRTFVVRTF